MGDIDDLVLRLRKEAGLANNVHSPWPHKMLNEAADVLHALAERNKELEEALLEIVGCFEAAVTEGLHERLVEQEHETGNLRDIVERRLMFADTVAERVLNNT